MAPSALAQPTRLDTFRLLVTREPAGVPAGELARLIEVPQNTMSAHLSILSRAGLIAGERHSRSILYRARLDRLGELMLFTRQRLLRRPRRTVRAFDRDADRQHAVAYPRCALMTDRLFNVLFLCTGNSARSILAESILRKDGAGRFRAFSAGSHPKGAVNPFAIKVLESSDYPTDGLRSKAWGEYAAPGAPVMDFVFTVCDSAAGEARPVWPGQPMTAHWGIEDPAALEGTDIQKEAAFVRAARYLKNQISAFANLPLKSIDHLALGSRLKEIGALERTSRPRAESA